MVELEVDEQAIKDEFRDNCTKKFTFHQPKTEEHRNNHKTVNDATLAYVNALVDVCPVSDELKMAVELIGLARNKANEALAIHVNANGG